MSESKQFTQVKPQPLTVYLWQCFLTIPALLYLVMVPMWTRTVRFANAYAYALIDILYTVLYAPAPSLSLVHQN